MVGKLNLTLTRRSRVYSLFEMRNIFKSIVFGEQFTAYDRVPDYASWGVQ
jgi:hypothetical protein